MFSCSPWLIVFGPNPPQCKSQSLTMQYGRDMFLVSDSCNMLNHVKPQLCAHVWLCQEAYSAVGACLTSRFHALSASKLANSCVFHQKWFLEMCFFFFLSPSVFQRGGERGVTGSGGRLGGRAADKSETCTRTRRWYGLCTRLLATKSWITQTKIYCRWRRLEEGRHGLWGKTNHKCFLN